MENSGQVYIPDATTSASSTAIPNDQVRIESLLEECVRTKASDLHLQVGLPRILRIDGALRPIPGYQSLDEAAVERLVFSTLEEEQKDILLKDKEFDYSFSFGDLGRFRVNAFHERGKLAAAFRLIPNQIKNIKSSKPKGILAYGKLPLMIFRNCPIKSNNGCNNCNHSIIDRKNIEFNVFCEDGVTKMINNRVDIGVRVETSNVVMEEINEL